jgi:spore maturation protein B
LEGFGVIDLFITMIVPLTITGVALHGAARRVDVYSALAAGAGDGLLVLYRIFPALVGLLTAVYMLRASGALELLTHWLAPVLTAVGLPPETAALMLIRPMSGSGALAVGSELMAQYGPDSYVGRVAAVMLGSTETTFYTITVYFGAAGIRKTRYTIPAALTADLAGFLFAALSVRLLLM